MNLLSMSYEAKESHEKWRDRQYQLRSEGLPEREKVGSAEWHERWIKYYEEIIKILEPNNIGIIK